MLVQAHLGSGQNLEATAASRRAMKLLEQQLELSPDDARACIMAGVQCSFLGDAAAADRYVKRALAIDADDPMLLYNVACVYSKIGKTEDAMSSLERAVDAGFGHKEWIEHDPDLGPIRDMPRFRKILETL
jgi:Flp pilus assembly protein TadD